MNAAEIEGATRRLASYEYWASATRVSQDRMWRLLAGQVDADYDRIAADARAQTGDPQGSLSLGEVDEIPAYYRDSVCIHGQPGGYLLDRGDDDLAAGILYEAGGNIYALGQGIGRRDSKAQRLIRHIRDTFPASRPARILEMGCSAGSQSADYPAAFPGGRVSCARSVAGDAAICPRARRGAAVPGCTSIKWTPPRPASRTVTST